MTRRKRLPQQVVPVTLDEARVAVTLVRTFVDWRRYAACAGLDTNMFIPRTSDTGATGRDQVQAAKRVCAGCPVQPNCLGLGLDDPSLMGVFGRTSPKDRQQLRRGLAREGWVPTHDARTLDLHERRRTQ